MNKYTDRLHALFQLEFFGMKLGLENIRALLDFLGHPERQFPSIHVAGTNGKGSVSAMLGAVHQAAGKRTGLYTSPHLVDFRERIRVDGEMISEAEVTNFLERIWPKVEELKATFFEVTTAMAFDHFARYRVDIAIVETGLGGRLDATNVLEKPLVTIVTSIGFDHTAQLGPTLESIASEKAGIFKPGVPAVVNCDPELNPVFEKVAREIGCEILFVRNWKVPAPFAGINPSLAGSHQKENVKTVLAAISVLPQELSFEHIRDGISNVASMTGLRARLEEIHSADLSERGLRLFLDVGHNPQALERMKEFFDAMDIRPIVIAGLMKDKNITEVLQILKSFGSYFVAVQAKTVRALPSATLTELAHAAGLPASDGGTVLEGLEVAARKAISRDTLLLTGSHYVIGEFLENFQRTGWVLQSAE
ncbi:MAG TPA: folylpolyglutamate synthase/dihydrofolate synthase family protein [Candidatus Kapabacteria bacterium]|nr:folylpolyglutamate synthase/dihydrofolate synthase family protein [Candidatus Kapabacteria bacterium]